MRAVKEAAEALEVALGTVEGLRVHRDVSSGIDPPCAVIGPPEIGWSGFCPDMAPTSARFTVHLVVRSNERTMERLWELVPAVALAIEQADDMSMALLERAAVPGTFPSGGAELPAYELSVDAVL